MSFRPHKPAKTGSIPVPATGVQLVTIGPVVLQESCMWLMEERPRLGGDSGPIPDMWPGWQTLGTDRALDDRVDK